jgi:hypothetical protein
MTDDNKDYLTTITERDIERHIAESDLTPDSIATMKTLTLEAQKAVVHLANRNGERLPPPTLMGFKGDGEGGAWITTHDDADSFSHTVDWHIKPDGELVFLKDYP